jgi:hypothetical protein
MQRVMVVDGWFVAGGHFLFFFFLFFSLPAKVHIYSLFFLFSILVFMFFISYFSPWPFWGSF